MKSLNLASIIAHLCGGNNPALPEYADNSLLLVRHGNTGKAPTDEERKLTEKGEAQAAATRAHLATNYEVTAVFSSSAQRAISTVSDPRWGETVTLGELYVSPEGTEESAVVDEAFRRLLYVPLSVYFTEVAVEAALTQWAERAALALETTFRERSPGDGAVVVGGHAVLSNSLAIAIAKAVDPEADVSIALDTSLGEAEAIEIRVVDGKVRMRHLNAVTLGHPVTA